MEEVSLFFDWFFPAMIVFAIVVCWLYLYYHVIPRLQKKYEDSQKQQAEQDEKRRKRFVLSYKFFLIILVIFSIVIIYCFREDKLFKPIARLMFWGPL